MRFSAIPLVVWALLMCLSVAQTTLPECTDLCYDALQSLEPTCTFDHNDCTCTNSSASAAAQDCILQSCTIKEWLVTMNATETICQRPVRNRSYVLIYCAATSGTVAFLAALIRLYITIRQSTFGYDDLFACLAACLSVPHSVGLVMAARFGLGRDIWTLTPYAIERSQRIMYVCQNLYFWCSGLQKLSFLLFFLRIFPSKTVRRWCLFGVVLSIGYSLGFGLTMAFACWPVRAVWTAWTREQQPVYCISQSPFYYSAATVNISSDLLIASIPIPHLWRLNLSLRKKLYLVAVFSAGFIVIAISCLRIQTLARISNMSNITYDSISTAVWSSIEIDVGIICICMPAFRRFLAHTLPKCFESTVVKMSLHREGQTLEPSGQKPSKKIIKTVDTHISSNRPEDDELQLVEMGTAKVTSRSSGDLHNTQSEAETLYKTQHEKTLPKEW